MPLSLLRENGLQKISLQLICARPKSHNVWRLWACFALRRQAVPCSIAGGQGQFWHNTTQHVPVTGRCHVPVTGRCYLQQQRTINWQVLHTVTGRCYVPVTGRCYLQQQRTINWQVLHTVTGRCYVPVTGRCYVPITGRCCIQYLAGATYQ